MPELPGQLRLGMLESIAAFAAEKLDASGRLNDMRSRHAKHYLDKGEQWAEDVHGHQAKDALAQLECERENLLEIFERSLTQMPPTADSATRTQRGIASASARKIGRYS